MVDKDNSNQNESSNVTGNSSEKGKFDFILKEAKSRKKDENFAFVWTIKALLISFIFLGIVYFLSYVHKNAEMLSLSEASKLINTAKLRSKLMVFGGNKNILVLGVDSNGFKTDSFVGTRSDSIILLNIDKYGKSLNAISIPRDSKVYLSDGKGINKINAAHAIGGPSLAINTIEENFGIDIHNYVIINYSAVKDFVKELGGVPVKVEKRMYYRDKSAGLLIDLKPGKQVLDENDAEAYLRFRHDAMGDIGRIKRQQWFVRALLEKMKSPDTILKIPKLLDIISKNVKTDLNVYELSKLLSFSKNVNLENIQVASLPGKPNKYGDVSYWIIDTDQTQEIIDKLIYREEIPCNKLLTVSIVFTEKYRARIPEIDQVISSLGFKVAYKTNDDRQHTQIIAHSEEACLKKVSKLRKYIPELKEAQFLIEPDRYIYPSTDYTIVLAD